MQQQEVIFLEATCQSPQLFYLNGTEKDPGTSWIKLELLPDNSPMGLSVKEYDYLWTLRPKEKLKIKKFDGTELTCPRYTRSYLKGYYFSNMDHPTDDDNVELPTPVKRILEECKTRENPNLNQCLVNWYEGDGGIGKHSDDTKSLLPDSDIYSFSFGPAVRTFIIEPSYHYKNDPNQKIVYARLKNNTKIIMGGKCQTTHCHSVQKTNNSTDRRLNVTFRCFAE